MERGVLVQTGSWPCENFSGRATRRNISEQLHLWESNHTAHARFDALLENCVFYILRMYEFLHSQGQTLPSRDFCGTAALPLKPDIGWRSWHVRKVPIPDSCSAANTGLCMTAKWNGPAVLLPCPKITLASAPKMKPS